MSKNFSMIGLFYLTILFLFACDDKTQLGLDLQSQDQLIRTQFADTFSIEAQMVVSEKLVTSRVLNLLAGRLQDDKFGSIEAQAYAKMLLGSDTAVRFVSPQNLRPIYDSAAVVMVINQFYGDTTQNIPIEVHRLLDLMDTAKTYYNTDRIPTGEIIAQGNIKAKKDQLIYSLPLKDSFARLLFSKQGQSEFANQDNFENFFSGIMIRCKSPNTAIEVGSANLYIDLYYHFEGDTARKLHTFRSALTRRNVDGTISILAGKHYYFNAFQTDFSQAQHLKALSSQPRISAQQTQHELYIQSGSDLMTHIKFPHLEKFNSQRNIFVNRAELSFHIDNQSFDIAKAFPPDITLWEANAKGEILVNELNQNVPIFREGANTQLQLLYNPNGRSYQDAVITSYIQDVISGRRANNGIILRASGFASNLKKVILNGRQEGRTGIKLKLYYTLIVR